MADSGWIWGVWRSSSSPHPPSPPPGPVQGPDGWVPAIRAEQRDVQRQESCAQAQALRPPSPLPTSDEASLDAGSAAMAAGPEQRRINVHARGGGGDGCGSLAETTGLQASWMHYSSAHRQWWPRGGPRAAEKELQPPPLPPPRPRPCHPLPPLQVLSQCEPEASPESAESQDSPSATLSTVCPFPHGSQTPCGCSPNEFSLVNKHVLCRYCIPSAHKHASLVDPTDWGGVREAERRQAEAGERDEAGGIQCGVTEAQRD